MALSYDSVVYPLTEVFDKPFLNPGTWKVTSNSSRRLARLNGLLPNPISFSTYFGHDGVAQAFKTKWAVPYPANTELELNASIDLTREDQPDSFTFLEPTIIHTTKPSEKHRAESVCKLTIPIRGPSAAPFSWSFSHPTVNAYLSGKLEKDLAFGLPADLYVSAFADEGLYIGAWASYDALRSGLKQYWVFARKDVNLGAAVGGITDGFAFLGYSSSSSANLGFSGQKKNIKFATRVSTEGLELALRRDCPYSGSTMAASFSTATKTLKVGVEAIFKGLWTVGVTAVAPDVSAPSWNSVGFGVKLGYN